MSGVTRGGVGGVTLLALVLGCEESSPAEALPAADGFHCAVVNPFSQEAECKAYGAVWTEAAARADCDQGQYNTPGDFGGGACVLAPTLGVCEVPGDGGRDYALHLGGDNGDFCSLSARACMVFLEGRFVPSEVCEGRGLPSGTPSSEPFVFHWPTRTCQPPLEGEPPGQSEGGEVCTWNLISACTEEGRRFIDYGDCDTVQTNRPYYSVPGREVASDDDPRLGDTAWLEDSAWVRSQVQSCACVCCHTDETTTDGPAKWSIDAGPLWTDTMSDTAISLFAGYVDSSELGAFDPADNNGFDRLGSALPTTDVDRMVGFFRAEFERRGISREFADNVRPIGGPLVEQRNYEPVLCDGEARLDADGTLHWSDARPARYVYVLSEGSTNPGIPPNFDLPEGTLWRVDVPWDAEPIPSGALRYGSLTPGATQGYPLAGEAPTALTPGGRYYLYVLADIAVPLARCLFDTPQ